MRVRLCARVQRAVCLCMDVFNYSRIVNKQEFDQLGTFILLVPTRSNAISKGFRVKVIISVRVRNTLRFRVMS